MSFTWQPRDLSDEDLANVAAPPCAHCWHWRPVHFPDPLSPGEREIRFCHAPYMDPDFGCFESAEEVKKESTPCERSA